MSSLELEQESLITMVYLPEPIETTSLRALALVLPCPKNEVVTFRAVLATMDAIFADLKTFN